MQLYSINLSYYRTWAYHYMFTVLYFINTVKVLLYNFHCIYTFIYMYFHRIIYYIYIHTYTYIYTYTCIYICMLCFYKDILLFPYLNHIQLGIYLDKCLIQAISIKMVRCDLFDLVFS